MTWLPIIWTYRRPLLALLLAAGLYATGYYKGFSTAASRCHEAELKTRITRLQRDLDAQKTADAYEDLARSQIAAARDRALAERDAYRAGLEASHPGDLCAYDRGDVERLRELRGWKG